jgi:hypothetical protein
LIDPATDSTALEVACYALQLPLKSSRLGGWGGRPGRTTLRDRAEQAAEMLVGLAGEDGDDDREALLDQATELLVQVHQRHPETEQARLLADALNLEDFGVIGLVEQAVALAQVGERPRERRHARVRPARVRGRRGQSPHPVDEVFKVHDDPFRQAALAVAIRPA